MYPPQLSITTGNGNFRKIPSDQEHLTSEGKITRSLKEISMRFRKGICGKGTSPFQEKGFFFFLSQICSPSFRALKVE